MSLRHVLFLLLPCVALAQDDATAKLREWGAASGHFRLSIAPEQPRYAIGDPIRLTVVLKNVSGKTVLLWTIGAMRFYQMDVRVPTPAWLPFRPQAQMTALGRDETAERDVSVVGREVPDGYEWKEEIEISKLFDMSAVGEYRIIFLCRQPRPEGDHRESKDVRVVIVSNVLNVVVVPK
jgi:hypothetical protein